MRVKRLRLFSLLLVFILMFGLVPSVYASAVSGIELAETTSAEENQILSDALELSEMEETVEETLSEDEIRWEKLLSALPEPYEEYFPYDPSIQYPYGIPVDNFYPSSLLEADPYGIMLLADMSKIPDEMYDNTILRALEYTGYDVQWLKDNGYLYVSQYVSSNILDSNPDVLSDIGYDTDSPYLNGDETVADSSTVTGRAPDIAEFERDGLVCASFVAYFINNYLPNIEGIDTTHIADAVKATTMSGSYYSTAAAWSWDTGLSNLASQSGSGVTKYTSASTAYANLVPGDVIAFSNGSRISHVAIYAGTYDYYNASGSNRGEYHFIIHVGNSRGPEISTVEYMEDAGSKSSTPIAWYHLDINDKMDKVGYIEVNKEDTEGNSLSGAEFEAVNQDTGIAYSIGPTNSNGYAISGELPFGTYKVTETVFPAGYQADGDTSWTVTLGSSTPNQTITIHAVNKLVTGGFTIQKETNTGKDLSGWQIGVYTDAACTKHISGSPFTTGDNGKINVTGLVPATYYVKELSGSTDFWAIDSTVKTVVVTDGSNPTVTITNTQYGYGKVIKNTNTGSNLSGWKFNIYTDVACTQLVSGSPFISAEDGTIAVKLLPGTYYVQEVDESAANPMWHYDAATQKLVVTAGETAGVTFTNQQLGNLQLIKSVPDGGSVAGWVFDIYRASDNAYMGSFTSGADGTILSNYLMPGDYLVYEQMDENSIYWCETENPKRVSVEAGKTTDVTFVNRLKTGKISVQKIDITGKPLAGAVFLLEWSVDGTNWLPVSNADASHVTEGTCTSSGLAEGTLISPESGFLEFSGLHPNCLYRLTEVAAPDGYQLLSGPAYEGGFTAANALNVELTVVNVHTFTLPETGSHSMLFMPLFFLAVSVMYGYFALIPNRKRG